MIDKISRFFVFCLMVTVIVSCGHRHTDTDEDTTDSLEMYDALEGDSTLFFDDDEGLTMHETETEVFGDFIFAFTHNKRFQAERIHFPLPVTELDGTERAINSGRDFRNEFLLPGNDYYTILLGDKSQMAVLESDTILESITMQVVELASQHLISYNFTRDNGKWFLSSCNHTGMPQQLSEFMDFYGQFVADSVFQQESVAERLQITIADEDEAEEEEEVEGTIERDQWPIFRPDMPAERFVNIDFGQEYPHPDHMVMLQCGISNSMMNTFSFRRENDKWKLTSYEN